MDLSIYRPSNLLYNQENLCKYRPGGYHPVRLGDNLKDGRYEIHHKLGWGGYSTVWLAKDRTSKQWVSIKVMTADSTRSSGELRCLQSLAEHCQRTVGPKYIVHLLDDFRHKGPNGIHQCLVFELLGPHVDKVLEAYQLAEVRLEPELVLRLSKQLLQGLAFIHEAGYAHGDISGSNVAFTSISLSKSTKNSLFKVLGTPESEALDRLDGKPLDKGLPSQLVKATDWDHWCDEDFGDIRILDLGQAFLRGVKPTEHCQPRPLRAPETFFTESFDHRIDLWRAGIMIYSFVFASIPFDCCLSDDDILIAEMIDLVGPLPAEWQPKWCQMRLSSPRLARYYSGDYEPSRSLEQRFSESVHDSLKPLLPVIKGLMRLLPSDRISAAQALHLLERQSQTVSKGQQGKSRQENGQRGEGQHRKEQHGKWQQDEGQHRQEQHGKGQQGKGQQGKGQQGKGQHGKGQQGKGQQIKRQQGIGQNEKGQEEKGRDKKGSREQAGTEKVRMN